MTRVLVVSVEQPWPEQHGGRLRTARIATALAESCHVAVAFPSRETGAIPAPVPVHPLPWHRPGSLSTRVSPRPHLGGHHLAPVLPHLQQVADGFAPDFVYWSHSYLAAWGIDALPGRRHVVEFANIEGDRFATLATSARGIQKIARISEHLKARRWEPAVARKAHLCVALSANDSRKISAWGGRTVLVPNGVDPIGYTPSPVDGYVLALASYDYEPNARAIEDFVRRSWPVVLSRSPHARLVIAGRDSEDLPDSVRVPGVEVIGTLDRVDEAYSGAALSLTPAELGGGAQLKVTESLSRGRMLVASPYSSRSVPAELRGSGACIVADSPAEYASAIASALDDAGTRHTVERNAWQSLQNHIWPKRVVPVLDAMSSTTTARS